MKGWECSRCGQIHTQNPSKCRGCGHNILTPVSGEKLKQNSEGVNTPDSAEVSHTVGSPQKESFDTSPDVAKDGSIQQRETQVQEETKQQGLIERLIAWIR